MDKKTQHSLLTITEKAAGAISAHRLITYNATQATLGNQCIGVSLNSADVGQEVPIAIQGVVLIELGATVSAGAMVSSDNFGKAKAIFGSEAPAGRLLIGGSSGDILPLLLIPS